MSLFISLTSLLVATYFAICQGSTEDLIYGYVCQQSKCVKVELSENNWNTAISLPVCRMFCGDTIGTLWPKPSGKVEVDHMLLHVNMESIDFQMPPNTKHFKLWEANRERFMGLLHNKVPNADVFKNEGHPLKIFVELEGNAADKEEVPRLTLDTDESYRLEISTSDAHEVLAKITAQNYFGARHGLETLSQLIIYDDIRRELQILAKASIEDEP
uniref:Beta-hexosaminidase eukaryotic type N-terminal domain-containing protein n=1 Tax=Stomoxys calcitrans TaxID=35570 RepID=A0A1I8PS49_STOCA